MACHYIVMASHCIATAGHREIPLGGDPAGNNNSIS
jgi:hypothetical protein